MWLSFALCVALLATVKSRMRRIACLIACFVVLGFFGGVASKFSFTEGTLFSKRQETIDYRWVNYRADVEMIKANPIFGIGWGLCGVCPGPAIAGLGVGNWPVAIALLAMIVGAYVQGRLFPEEP